MGRKGWGSSTCQGGLNLVKDRDVVSILKEWDEKWVIHEQDGYLEGHYKDPNANQPAVRGEGSRWSRHYCN